MPMRIFLILCSMILAACVTINIYFPAAAAEKAADRIIDEVWQIPKSQEGESEVPAEGSIPSQ